MVDSLPVCIVMPKLENKEVVNHKNKYENWKKINDEGWYKYVKIKKKPHDEWLFPGRKRLMIKLQFLKGK